MQVDAPEEPDALDRIGADVAPPSPGEPHDPQPGRGRLADLASWWARVSERNAPERTVAIRIRPWDSGVNSGTDAGTDGGTDAAPRAAPATATSLTALTVDAPRGVDDAIALGVACADQAADSGADLLLVAIDDRFGAGLLAASLMGLDPVEAAGWPRASGGSRIDDDAWIADVARLRDALHAAVGLRGQPAALLRALDLPAHALGTALLLRAAARRTPAILDGHGAASAALLARRVARGARDWWLAGQGTDAALHARALAALELEPLTRLDITVEDGTGALLGLAVLEAALR